MSGRNKRKSIMSNQKKIEGNVYRSGQLRGFPLNIVLEMLDEQVRQGNDKDVGVFENNVKANKHQGGFSWREAKKDYQYWQKTICPLFCKNRRESIENTIESSPANTGTPPANIDKAPHLWMSVDEYDIDLLDGSFILDRPFLAAVFDDAGRLEYFNLCQIQDEVLERWDPDELEFVVADEYIDDITHIAAYPRLNTYPIKEEVENIVKGWCDRQHEEIPETDEQTLIDSVIDWYRKRSNVT